jgi:hypothetical protein
MEGRAVGGLASGAKERQVKSRDDAYPEVVEVCEFGWAITIAVLAVLE